MSELYIAGTILGVILMLGVAYWINTKQRRHSSQIRAETPQMSEAESTFASLVQRPIVWAGAFFAVLAAVAFGVISVLNDPSSIGMSATDAIVALFGVLFVGFITYNVYAVARNRGHSSAMSIAEGIAVFVLFAFATVGITLIFG